MEKLEEWIETDCNCRLETLQASQFSKFIFVVS